MDISYRERTDSSALLVESREPLEDSAWQLKILLGNRIPCLIPFQIERFNSKLRFCYDITSCTKLDDALHRHPADAAALAGLFLSFLDSAEILEDYLLDPACLLLQRDTIYLTSPTLSSNGAPPLLVYVPQEASPFRLQLLQLAAELLTESLAADEGAVILLGRLIHLLQKPTVSSDELRRLLESFAGYAVSGAAGTAAGYAVSGAAGTAAGHAGSGVHTPKIPGEQTPDQVSNPGSQFGVLRGASNSQDSSFTPLYAKGEHADISLDFKGDGGIEDVSKKGVLPERSTFRSVLYAAVPALFIYLFLHAQNLFLLDTAETAGFACLSAACVLAVLSVIDRFRKKKAALLLSDAQQDDDFMIDDESDVWAGA